MGKDQSLHILLSYAVFAWGSACHVCIAFEGNSSQEKSYYRLIFFATLYDENTVNLLDLLTVENIFTLRLLQFSYQWHKKQLPSIFENHFRYVSEVHTYNTRYASKDNFYKARPRTNIGKTTLSALAVDH